MGDASPKIHLYLFLLSKVHKIMFLLLCDHLQFILILFINSSKIFLQEELEKKTNLFVGWFYVNSNFLKMFKVIIWAYSFNLFLKMENFMFDWFISTNFELFFLMLMDSLKFFIYFNDFDNFGIRYFELFLRGAFLLS